MRSTLVVSLLAACVLAAAWPSPGWAAQKAAGAGLRGLGAAKLPLSSGECRQLGGSVETDSKCPATLQGFNVERVHCNRNGYIVCINDNR
jgi:hypothetical protein